MDEYAELKAAYYEETGFTAPSKDVNVAEGAPAEDILCVNRWRAWLAGRIMRLLLVDLQK